MRGSATPRRGLPPPLTLSPQGGEGTACTQIEGFTLRQLALRAIAETQWVPPTGQNRITGMIEAKPDWVLSRQRAWGVPIPIFVKDNPDGSYEILKDERVNRRIVAAIEAKGISAWHEPGAAERFLGNDYSAAEWKKVDDICDVWFELRLHPRLHAGGPGALPAARRHPAQARRRRRHRHVPGRLRPAPRLVPLLAAGELRHARPRPLRRRAHPRLHPRREGRGEDVEVQGQHALAAGADEEVGRRHPAAVGGVFRLHERHPLRARRYCKAPSRPTASSATRCAGCWARLPTTRAASSWRSRRCPSWSS